MKPIRRFFISVASHFDEAVSKLENHEATAKEVIAELERAQSQAAIHLRQLRKRKVKLEEESAQATTEANKWLARARTSRETDRARGLECLRRAKEEQSRVDALSPQIKSYDALEKEVERSIGEIASRRELAAQRLHELSAKQVHARALRITEQSRASSNSDLDELFLRWELTLGAPLECAQEDELKESFESEEERVALECELDQL